MNPVSTFAGGTVVSQGVLTIENANALGAAGGGNTTTVLDGGQLQVQNVFNLQQVLSLGNATANITTFTLAYHGGTPTVPITFTTAPITYTGVAATDINAITNALTPLMPAGVTVSVTELAPAGLPPGTFIITFGRGDAYHPGLRDRDRRRHRPGRPKIAAVRHRYSERRRPREH